MKTSTAAGDPIATALANLAAAGVGFHVVDRCAVAECASCSVPGNLRAAAA